MDDGLSFNFDSSAAPHVKKPASNKQKATSQRWTDRAKRTQTTKRKTGQKLLKSEPVPRLAPKRVQNRASLNQDAASSNAQDSQSLAAPSDVILNASRPAQTGSSRPSNSNKLDSATGKPKAFISSLFSSLPELPASKKVSEPIAPQEPSNAPAVGTSFASLGLTQQLSDTLQSAKFNLQRPTAIQKQSIPALLTPQSERDHIIQAQTGSGKTLSYLLPIVQDLLSLSIQFAKEGKPLDRSVGTLAIITVPTRELANQIYQVAQNLLSFSVTHKEEGQFAHRWLTPGLLSGGMSRQHEKARLRKGVPLLIATPGRLLDHLQTTTSFRLAGEAIRAPPDPSQRPKKRQKVSEEDEFAYEDQAFDGNAEGIEESDDDDFTKPTSRSYRPRKPNYTPRPAQPDPRLGLRWLVLDEADRLMDMGFEPQIKDILHNLEARARPATEDRPRRRAVLCSATMQGNVKDFAGQVLQNPEMSQSDADGASSDIRHAPPSQLQQSYIVVPPKLRFVALLALLRQVMAPPTANLKAPKSAGRKVLVFMSCTDSVDLHWSAVGGLQMGRTTDSDMAKKAGGTTDEDGLTLAQYSQLMPKTPVYRLHGSLDLPTRMASLKAFTDAPGPAILFCTSLAARGIDVPFVRCVIQCDLPTEGGATEYIHRVGRTARAGTAGEAWSFVLPSEVGWVDWAEQKMAAVAEGSAARLNEVSVDEVLANGLGGLSKDYETRATDVQMAFERWVEDQTANANLARSAFSSHIRAYATHPSEEKTFFHVKNLQLGHIAKAFGLREAPKGMGRNVGGQKATNAKAKLAAKAEGAINKKRSRQSAAELQVMSDNDQSDIEMAELAAAAGNGGSKRVVQPRTGRALEGRGLKPARGGQASEFNIGNIADIDRMLKRYKG